MSNACQIDVRWNLELEWNCTSATIWYSTDDDTFDIRKLYSTRMMTPTCHGKEKVHEEE
jgi:hypothetical protein